MSSPYISTQELKDAYIRAHMFRIGMSFERACSIRTVKWALEKSALARRQRLALPEQPRLI
jgi:hypothetical protein